MKIKGEVYFDPWVGDNYGNGIEEDKILVIGFQHWCDPTYWGCNKDPHECLDKRDRTCTVWNSDEYKKNKIKVGWQHTGNNDLPTECPLYKKCEEKAPKEYWVNNKKRGELICYRNRFRFLHCETKIAIYDHIKDQERAKRASIFGAVLTALEELYSINFENNKKNCWNSIAFTNFIQHYTKIDPKNPNRININDELTKVLSEKNSEALDYLINDSNKEHKYLEDTPSVIIALNINKKTMGIIKGICVKHHYIECKNISIMTPMGGTFTFTVFATEKSSLYKKIKLDWKAFIDNYVIKNLQVNMDAKDLEITKSKMARKIQALAEFLKEQKELERKKVSDYRNDILKNNNTHESIRKVFYSDKDHEKQKISMFTEVRKPKVKHLLDEEIDSIRVAFEGKAK